MMVVYALASAIIVLWMAYLPTLMGSILTILNIVPTHLSSASDTSVPFDDRWNAFATTIKTLGKNDIHGRVTIPAEDMQQRIPVGCEPAFSHLIKAGNFSTRCVASVDIYYTAG